MLGSFFGRFGDTKPRKQYAPQEIGGTHKFKKKEAPAERFDEPVPEKEWEFWELPKVYTFREWHNYWRQYLRRCFVLPRSYQSQRARPGKKLMRAMKREKVRAMKLNGHPRGDNRPVIARFVGQE